MKKTKTKQIKKVKKEKAKITKDMTFHEVAQKFPETHKVFFSMGMHCLGCPMAMQETIEQGAAAHGEDINKLLKKLNDVVKKKSKKK